MSEIDQFERRIATALDRISAGLERMRGQLAEGGPGLRAELEAERASNASLQRRVRSLRERRDETEARMTQKVERLLERVENQDTQLERMRALNAQLREANAALRAAQEEGLADPEALNRSIVAELETLRELRAAEADEIDQILAELKPLIEEEAHA